MALKQAAKCFTVALAMAQAAALAELAAPVRED